MDEYGNQSTTFGPRDLLGYFYAVLHSPTYRSRYAEFLRTDFPRIPFIGNTNLLTLKPRP